MDLAELAQVLWRRKIVAAATLAVVIGVALLALSAETRLYKSTSTVALVPIVQNDAIFIISQTSTIAPLYGEAITSRPTLEAAQGRLGSQSLARITVRSFSTPVLKIDAVSADPRLAQRSADAVTDALLDRVGKGEVGIPQLKVLRLNTPVVPRQPFSPQPKLTIAIALVLGLGLAVGAALAMETIGRKVEDAETLAKVAGVPVYGEIPRARVIPNLHSARQLVDDPSLRVVAEALRDLRTNIQFTDGEARSVLVTSPEGRHGKTTTSFGLATMFARTGARTLLVDGDLRRGRLAEMLRMAPQPGLADVLRGGPPGVAIRSADLDNLSVLPSGALLDDPGELLESSFFTLLHRLEREYDVVVVDGPPLIPVNDARVMAKYVGVTLLVTRAGELSRRQVKAAVERLSIISVPLTAVVLNNARTPNRDSYTRYLKPVERAAAKPAI